MASSNSASCVPPSAEKRLLAEMPTLSESPPVPPSEYWSSEREDQGIAEWRGKSFVQRYRVLRDADLIMECDEVRIFAGRRDGDPTSIRALEIPPTIRERCE